MHKGSLGGVWRKGAWHCGAEGAYREADEVPADDVIWPRGEVERSSEHDERAGAEGGNDDCVFKIEHEQYEGGCDTCHEALCDVRFPACSELAQP